MEVLPVKDSTSSDFGLRRPLEGIHIRPEEFLTAFPGCLAVMEAEREPVDEAATLVTFRPEHQCVEILPPNHVIGWH
jgi:hypothetical protein